MASSGDPVVAIACTFSLFAARGHQTDIAGSPPAEQEQQKAVAAAAAAPAAGEGEEVEEEEEEEEEEEGRLLKVSAAAAVAGGPAGLRPHRRHGAAATAGAADRETLLFLLHPGAARQRQEAVERSAGPGGAPARVLLFGSEAELLLTWLAVMRSADPDVIGLFQVGSRDRGCWVGRLEFCRQAAVPTRIRTSTSTSTSTRIWHTLKSPRPQPKPTTGQRHAGCAAGEEGRRGCRPGRVGRRGGLVRSRAGRAGWRAGRWMAS